MVKTVERSQTLDIVAQNPKSGVYKSLGHDSLTSLNRSSNNTVRRKGYWRYFCGTLVVCVCASAHVHPDAAVPVSVVVVSAQHVALACLVSACSAASAPSAASALLLYSDNRVQMKPRLKHYFPRIDKTSTIIPTGNYVHHNLCL